MILDPLNIDKYIFIYIHSNIYLELGFEFDLAFVGPYFVNLSI